MVRSEAIYRSPASVETGDPEPIGSLVSFQEAACFKLGLGFKPFGVWPWLRPIVEARTILCKAIF